MKKVLLSTLLLTFVILATGQVGKRQQIAFDALYNSANGDNWTVKDIPTLLGRTNAPWAKTRVGYNDPDLGEPNGVPWFTVFDLSNNNLDGTIEDDLWYLPSYQGKEDLNRHGIFSIRNDGYFKVSHNKITAINAPHFGHGVAGSKYYLEISLDNNLLTEVNFNTVADNTSYKGVLRFDLHQNEITTLTRANFDYQDEGKCFMSAEMQRFRIDNNRLDFVSLIDVYNMVKGMREYQSSYMTPYPNAILDYFPQKPLGGDATETTLANGAAHTLNFSLNHAANVYSWTLNGKDVPNSTTKDFPITINAQTTGVYRCKITNPAIPGGALYSYDMAVFMEKAGNKSITDLNFSGVSVLDNFPENSIVGDFSATDPDGDEVYYRLPDNTADNSHFRILNGKTLVSAETLFEKHYIENYTITVEGYDVYGGKFQKDILIEKGVSTGTPLPTSFSLKPNTIEENAANTAVGQITLTGVDASHGYVLSLAPGADDNDLFVIDGTTLKNIDAFDFETKKQYAVRVTATANDGTSASSTMTVNVTNANDAPHDISLTNNTIQTKTSIGTLVGYLNAADQDKIDKAFTYAFTVGYPDNANFTIIDNTLNLKTYFTETKTLNIGVTVTDPHGATYNKEFSISIVADINADNRAPRMIGLTNMVILPTMKANDKVSDIVLSDPDGDLGTFTITNDYLEVRGSALYLKSVPTAKFTASINANDGANDLAQTFTFYVATETTTDVLNLKASIDIKVYPNPTESMIYVDGVDEGTFSLVSVTGETVKTSYVPSINVDDLSKGYYILKIDTGDEIITRKIIKK